MNWRLLILCEVPKGMLNLSIRQDTFTTNIEPTRLGLSFGAVVRIKDGVVKPVSTPRDFTLSNILKNIVMNNLLNLILAE